MDSRDLASIKRALWSAADELRANSTLAPTEYRGPVLGLIFLAYAEHRFEQVRPELEAGDSPPAGHARRLRAKSVLFLPEEARLSYLVNLPESRISAPRSTRPCRWSRPTTQNSAESCRGATSDWRSPRSSSWSGCSRRCPASCPATPSG